MSLMPFWLSANDIALDGYSRDGSLAKLLHPARVHDQDAVAVGEGVDAVSYRQDCVVSELLLDGFLEEAVRFHVDARCGLVNT